MPGGQKPSLTTGGTSDRRAHPMLSPPTLVLLSGHCSSSHIQDGAGTSQAVCGLPYGLYHFPRIWGATRGDLIADLPTWQDIQAMAASIVSALFRELHDIKQQVDMVEEQVATLETSKTTVDTPSWRLLRPHTANTSTSSSKSMTGKIGTGETTSVSGVSQRQLWEVTYSNRHSQSAPGQGSHRRT